MSQASDGKWAYTAAWAILILGFVYLALDVTGVFRSAIHALEGHVSNSWRLGNLIVAPLSAGIGMVDLKVPAVARFVAFLIFLISFSVLPLSLARFPAPTWSVSGFLWLEIFWLIPKFNSWHAKNIKTKIA